MSDLIIVLIFTLIIFVCFFLKIMGNKTAGAIGVVLPILALILIFVKRC